MKLSILTIAMIAVLIITGCGSNKNSDGEVDSNLVDSNVLDTSTIPVDTNFSDTTSLPKDSMGKNQ